MKRGSTAGALLGASLALAACGGDSTAAPAPTDVPNHSAPGTNSSLRIIDVSIRDDGLHPRKASLRLGAGVRWTNRDDRVHTVTSVPGARQQFDSGRLKPGESFSISTTEGGRSAYRSTAPGDGKRFRGIVVAG